MVAESALQATVGSGILPFGLTLKKKDCPVPPTQVLWTTRVVGGGGVKVFVNVQTTVSPASGVNATPRRPSSVKSSPVQVRFMRAQFADGSAPSVTV